MKKSHIPVILITITEMNDPAEKKKVLVVDDEFHITTLLQVALESEGYEVMVANNGVEALELVELKTPDIILLDINMPRMDGWTVCERLKSDERTKPIPIIIVTAYVQPEHREKSFKVGANDFVEKPFDVVNLLAKIAKFLANP